MLDPASFPAFCCYCTISFDNMAPTWGVGWRKCDTRGPAAVPSMFPEASENRRKKTLIFGCPFASILAPFGIQVGSILGSFFASVSGHISDAFFLKCVVFPIPQILNFGALAYAPCDFSSFLQIANKYKTNATSLQLSLIHI